MARTDIALLLTCEHASKRIPPLYREVAERAGKVLDTHRGWDPGALSLARQLARRFRVPLMVGRYSRLLIELNRSPHHPRLWSGYSRTLPAVAKAELLARYYHPYRDSVVAQLSQLLSRHRRVVHVSVHSFTPVLGKEVRNADVGLLYDPGRSSEKQFCLAWEQALSRQAPQFRVRRNYPYRGIADGLVTQLRKQFPVDRYAGVELEVNQRFPLADPTGWRRLRAALIDSLEICLEASRESAGVHR